MKHCTAIHRHEDTGLWVTWSHFKRNSTPATFSSFSPFSLYVHVLSSYYFLPSALIEFKDRVLRPYVLVLTNTFRFCFTDLRYSTSWWVIMYSWSSELLVLLRYWEQKMLLSKSAGRRPLYSNRSTTEKFHMEPLGRRPDSERSPWRSSSKTWTFIDSQNVPLIGSRPNVYR